MTQRALLRALDWLKLLYRRTTAAALSRSAAQLAFYSLFALFPFLLILFSLASYLPVEGVSNALLGRARQVLPSEAYDIVQSHVRDIIGTDHPRLLSLGLVLTLWSSSRAIDALRVGLNRATGAHESRPIWKRELMALAMTLLLAALLLVSVSIMVVGSRAGAWLLTYLGFSASFTSVWAVFRWPLTVSVMLLGLALCYGRVPDGRHRIRFGSPGAVVAVVVLLGATWGFSFYLGHFNQFNVAYGSIGGVLILLTWLYISGFIVLVGAEIDALLEAPSSPEGEGEADERPAPEA